MPWVMRKNDNGKTCVYKEGADGEPTGDSLGCHATEAEAKQQMAALYANIHKAVKFIDGKDDEVEGLLLPYGGVHNGRDLDGQFFSKKTDFCLDWFLSERPALYHHGMDEDAGASVVGRVKSIEIRDDGGWMRAQLDRRHKFFTAISEMVKKGDLSLSSGAMAHLVKVEKSGEILRWPVVEGSLTPTPSNLLAIVDLATAEKHYKSAGLEIPEAAKAKLDAAALADLPDSDFAYIDSGGGRHLPMNDEAHARNAVARFDQTAFEDTAAKQKAWRKLMARCKELGVEVSEDVMEAHKASDLDSLSLIDHAILTAHYAASLSQRTKDLRERRTKEGRVLSTMNRKRLTECVASMRMAMEDLQGLLDQTEPAKAGNILRLRAQLEASRLHSLTIN